MKYSFELRSRASEDETISRKHEMFTNALVTVSPPWGFSKNAIPSAPDPGAELVAYLGLGKYLGKGVQGDVYYQFRRRFRDEGSDDDFVDLTFNSAKVDFPTLAYEVFPKYVAAFDAYRAEIAHDEFSYVDYDTLREQRSDFRNAIHRVFQVCFFDKLLCLRALNLTPKEVMSRLRGSAEAVRLLHDGVHIIGRSAPMSFADADKLSKEWRMRLQ
jgi:hypothetical protein